MIAMRYKIMFQDEYDMEYIRERVRINGEKTDGFHDLLFKAYLVSENRNGESGRNEYSPLYLWKDSGGMNEFIFGGYYDNILTSFGWQNIHTGIPALCCLNKEFALSQYMVEVERKLPRVSHMCPLAFSMEENECTGKVLIYHPDTWQCFEYYFYKKQPQYNNVKLYSVLHLSMGK